MQPLRLAATLLLSVLVTFSVASQMQLNYFSDHYCSKYLGNTQVTWGDSMADYNGDNCYNYHFGNSVGIADCWAGQRFCTCLFFYQKNCKGDYATVQSGGFDGHSQWEWNCLLNADAFNSIRCYSY